MKEQQLPLLDWILLPALALLTIGSLSAAGELAARRLFYGSATVVEDCLIMDDKATGVRAIPNSACHERGYESPWVEYRFNRCGQRADSGCEPKRPGTYRIAMVGSSTAMGYEVPEQNSLAALLPAELARRTGQRIDLQNDALLGEYPNSVALRSGQLVAAQPDLVLWVLTSWDVENSTTLTAAAPKANHTAVGEGTLQRLRRALAEESVSAKATMLGRTVYDLFNTSRMKFLFQHLLYQSQSEYMSCALNNRGALGDSLKADFGPAMQEHFRQFDRSFAELARQAAAAHVPVAAVFLPSRVQAAMISTGQWPPEFDPYHMDNQLRAIVESHGGLYLSVLREYRSIPNPERNFYPVDSHPNAQGHATIANLLLKHLTSGAIPGLKAATQTQVALGQGRN